MLVMRKSSIKVVDLFCGAGGLTFGLELAGIEVVEGVDIDPACRYPYEANTKARHVQKNVHEYQASELRQAWGNAEYRVLVGCAPCQPFSTYTQGNRGTYKTKWVLLNKFADLVVDAKPDIVSMENVTPLERTLTFCEFVQRLKQEGYHVSHSVVDCRHYGAPQMRRRLVLLASRFGSITMIEPTHPNPENWATVEEVIGDLPVIEAGSTDVDDHLHRSSRLSGLNLMRIKASKPGGTWKDWPHKLIAKCHRKESGKTYLGVYGRMKWEKPSPTITGQSFGFGNGRFGHPEQDRAISLREAAILQTFPPNYTFVKPGGAPAMKAVGRMIGNAVPPTLGKAIGLSVARHLADVGR